MTTLDERIAAAPGGPIEDYVAALSAALHGPDRAKERMVKEIRDGLTDTAAAYASDEAPGDEAARRAVRDFGTVDELLPGLQRELTIAQARHTARTAAVTVPVLALVCILIRTAEHDPDWPLRALASHLAGLAAVAGVLATAALAATGPLARWLPTPHRLPLVIAWTGTGAAVAMGVATLGLATTSALATHWTLMVLAGALTAFSHAVVAASARTCRQCARLAAQ
ncbi:permease prefix domain 1-containing protein [Streptoalloteichus hindustanus]|uniref:Uncharacterized protein n=1 Tax=Streptoalloteichus hindustanus TaxID=2017 RepID=A0A1M5MGV2_STRHI|nr:permease prefix domain 1-containing protein [Streptoalloteichus hindustanus]SHG76421.1 hypothetical protein SAMN05444320_113113 [Streptoalloteichus hindustanus]